MTDKPSYAMEAPPAKDGKVTKNYRMSNYRADAPDTTVWQDIFDKKIKGEIANDVYEKLVEVENMRQVLECQEQNVAKFMKKDDENTDSSDISGFSDLDGDEQEMVNQIKQSRIQQQQQYAAARKYGSVIEMNRMTYKENVQTDGHVIVHISSDHLPECRRVHMILKQLADKFPTLKICRIPYQEANKDYPEDQCPTLLIYTQGTVVKSLVGVVEIGGRGVTMEELEWKLHQLKIVTSDLEADPSQRVDLTTWVNNKLNE
ncbi:Thioredoxin-like_family protein [Hexamita inflata]|uniref:Thioredoxin-like family protein n=1 Tax=Hexamita inflata TaxID=28002 RepID=A0AA86QEY2_9EUKA|nr:Thioredoxin-like family protein [Hexamita inflata]CAI9959439.1 Thioredoxin-like family protein [Hexamita inflata]